MPYSLPGGFIPPCLPTKAPSPPSGEVWLHEIKHDGFRVIARKDGARVRLYSRNGHDLPHRFVLIVGAVTALRSRSCIIDGEAVCCGENGVPSFDRIRYRRHDADVFLYAFDLIEFNGDDLRSEPLAVRKSTPCAVPVARNSAAIPVRRARVFMAKRSSIRPCSRRLPFAPLHCERAAPDRPPGVADKFFHRRVAAPFA
jgi:hypothetical protein